MLTDAVLSSVVIRRAVSGDAPGIARVFREAVPVYCRSAGIELSRISAFSESCADIEAAIGRSEVFVAVVGSDVLGTIRVDESSFPEFYISRFYVLPSSHGKGIGSLLLQHALTHIGVCGGRSVTLHTALSHTFMVHYYRKRGFSLLSVNQDSGYSRGLFLFRFS